MASGKEKYIFTALLAACLTAGIFLPAEAYAQKSKKDKKKEAPAPPEHKTYRVEGGQIVEQSATVVADSASQTVVLPVAPITSDSTDKLLSPKEQRRLERAFEDSTLTRYSPIFRDTMPISRMTAVSLVVPGFGQLHNKQYWKIPVAYATLGASIWGFSKENKPYKNYKSQYDDLVAHNATRDEIDPIQTKMIQHNTYRQLCMAGIYVSWIYFVCDGVVNYPGTLSSVKKATTLSTVLPGAGQFYNQSYWKVPIVVGGFATMAYMIDWNNRGYQRFKLAYDQRMDGDPTTVDEFENYLTDSDILNYKKSYRRNRDLCIILTGAFYLLNIIDAHVDSQLKNYDISDDLSMTLEPTLFNFYTMQRPQTNIPGLSFCIRF